MTGAVRAELKERAAFQALSLVLHLGLLGALLGSHLLDPVPLRQTRPAVPFVELISGTEREGTSGGERAKPTDPAAPAAAVRRSTPTPTEPAAPVKRSSAPAPPAPAAGEPPHPPAPRAVAPPLATRPAAAMALPGAPLAAAGDGAARAPSGAAAGSGKGGGESAAGAGAGTGAGKGRVGDGTETRRHGSGASNGDRIAAYRRLLTSLIEAHKKYPIAARRMRQEGTCRRLVVLSRDGTLKGVETLSSCGHDFLDEAATGAIKAVGDYPPFPAELLLNEARFDVTITFGLSR